MMYNTFNMKSLKIFMQNNRTLIYSITYLIAISIGTIVIHEIGHLLMALALGVPLREIKINFIGINPGLKMPDGLSASFLTYIGFAGGFFAAAILSASYFVFLYRKYRIKPSLLVWCMGLITLGTCGEEIGNAIVEGHFHALYIYSASSPFNKVNLMIILIALLGALLHLLIFPFPKMKKKT